MAPKREWPVEQNNSDTPYKDPTPTGMPSVTKPNATPGKGSSPNVTPPAGGQANH